MIFTHLLSCLQALQYMKLGIPLIGKVIRKCVFLTFGNKDIILCWVPSHVGIKDNEKTDYVAKSALEVARAKVGEPYNDFQHKINHYILSTW